MGTNNNPVREKQQESTLPSKGNGPEGVDKAPGEETSATPGNPLAEALKGKKVDGDPSQPADQPVPVPGT